MIEAAESLFGSLGVEGVSTRQLAAAIGSSNTNVVAYYFGKKEALVEAVYRHRLPEIDRRRGELLGEAISMGQADDLAVLVRAFAQPLFEQTDREGRHSYARFVAAIERSGLISTRGQVEADFPETAALIQQITASLENGSASATSNEVRIRLRLAMALIVSALQIADQRDDATGETRSVFDTALAMATAGLAAPVISSKID
ncbi:TetR/AcrR family transcriptional regulator [Sphingomonas sp. LaA6.9]|uniref:TetR/AcrR family transcriptional regulator n=1 Tax=Sphingomonas sp. LaA6.9 TaxID=2919914 RepID=UPI001F500C1F|nr:TetR/AcrR family transcriptional regulator [Sphingomonas sp. LaA6.9]MCJ8157659.1 TetR family transcriptional regulator [Sphingomonas sp. LaA6.9]